VTPSLAELIAAGAPLTDELLVDCHCHMGKWPRFGVYEGDAEGMLRTMDRCGLDVAACSHHAAIGPDTRYGNDEVERAMLKWPDRFVGYCALNGRHSEESIVDELERRIGRAGFSGIKLHPSVHQCPVDTPTLTPAFELADQRGLPVLVHTWHNDSLASPAAFERLASTYTKAAFILGHTGGTAEGAEQYLPVAREHDNIYLDLTGSMMQFGVIEMLVNEMGDERVLYGSDLPFIDCRPMLGYIGFARVPDDSKRRILGLNAARLFGLTPPWGLV